METKVFTTYLGNLNQRFKQDQEFISEDCIRYDFSSAMLSVEHLQADELILEYPLDRLLGSGKTQKEIDCVIPVLKTCIEFKFWKTPCSNGQAHTMSEGQLFSDFPQLRNIKDFESRLVIIVSSRRIRNHLNNRWGFYNDEVKQTISKHSLESRPKTFQKHIGIKEYSDL
jgi:hypothetical protein